MASATRGLSHTAYGSSRRNAWFKLSRPQPHLGGTVSVVWYFFWSRSELFTQQSMDQSPHPLFRVSVDRKLTGPLARQRQVRERDHSDLDVVFVLISVVTGKCAQSRVESLGGRSKYGSSCLGGVIEFTVVCANGRLPHLWCWRHTACDHLAQTPRAQVFSQMVPTSRLGLWFLCAFHATGNSHNVSSSSVSQLRSA